MTREQKKAEFIRQLAEFLVKDEASKGCMLAAEYQTPDRGMPKLAGEWSDLRAHTPIRGYTSVEEAIKILAEFLS